MTEDMTFGHTVRILKLILPAVMLKEGLLASIPFPRLGQPLTEGVGLFV